MSASYPSLDAQLAGFADHRSADFLDRLAADLPADNALLLYLVAFAEQADPSEQQAATGLLKRYAANGASLPLTAAARLLTLLPALVNWESRVHGLQMLAALPIPEDCAPDLHDFLRGCLRTERNRFVRAWAYAGLHRLASLHPDYRVEVSPLLNEAARNESASVRARLRHLPGLSNSGPGSSPRRGCGDDA